MSWASRRRFAYLTVLFLIFFIPASLIGFVWWYKAPTCFDGILNQNEYSIDKGGPCVLLDERQLTPYAILWSRPFMVRDGTASASAYIENPNSSAGVRSASYRMRVYDEKNVLVAEKEGFTPVMPGTITPVFEGGMPTGARTAVRAFFEFTEPLVWERLEDRARSIEIKNKVLVGEDSQPRLEAMVINTSPQDFEEVVIVATLFDTAGNAFASSQTVIPFLRGKSSTEVLFTWTNPFARRVSRTDILPILTPVDVSVR